MRAQDAGPTRSLAAPPAYDERALRRLRHRDLEGLVDLMDDYQSLADELEEVGDRKTDPDGPPSRRAA